MSKKNVLTRALKKQAEYLFRESRFPEASIIYEKICSTDRADIDARVMLAITMVHTGDFGGAEDCCRKALKINPDHALGHHALGTALERQGKLGEAVTEFRNATGLSPDFPNAHLFLANALAELGESGSAEDSYHKALQLDPGMTQAMAGLGRLCMQTGRMQEAETWFRKALEAESGNVDFMTALGDALCIQGRQHDALPVLQQAILADPDAYQTNYSLGTLLTTLGKFDDAIRHYRKALDIRPDDEYATGALAGILERRSEFEEARDLLKPFVEAGAASAGIAFPFAELAKHFGNNDEAAGVLEKVLTDPALDQKTRTDIHFRLGKLLDAAEEYDRAFAHYHQANQFASEVTGKLADIDHIDRQADRLLQQVQSCGKDFWTSLSRADNRSERPIFVVGMPRSGTTLTEQILASHPDIYGAGELSGINNIASSICTGPAEYPSCLRNIPGGMLEREASHYLLLLDTLSSTAAHVVDKYPHNFMHLGLISVLFPAARVIHISRDPRDTCLSIYFQIFAQQHAYSSNLVRLGRHYRTYEKLMQYWNSVLDYPVLNIRYEQLLAEPENTVRTLLDFCGMKWDDSCLKFHETRRDVNTPSYDQVRQPLYMKSVDRWKHYRNHLGELTQALLE